MEVLIDTIIDKLTMLKSNITYENETELLNNEIFKNRMDYIIFYIKHLNSELDELKNEIDTKNIYNNEYKKQKIEEYTNIKSSISKIFSIYNYIEHNGETCID